MTKTKDTVAPHTAVDRRRHARIPHPVPIQIISHEALGNKSYDGMGTDISLDGVAFETEAELFLQDAVELVFEIKNKEVRRFARLLYRAGRRYGAYFVRPE